MISSAAAALEIFCPAVGAVNYGTWESLVAGLANAGELRKLRKEARASGKLPPPAVPLGPKLRVSNKATYNKSLAAYALPFPGALPPPK